MLKEYIYNCWTAVMDSEKSPLRHIPNPVVRHMILQILAWMWCIIFSFYIGSFIVFGISAAAHALLLAGIVITVSTFETARRKK